MRSMSNPMPEICHCGVPAVENISSQRRFADGAGIASRGRSCDGTRPESVLLPVTSNRITMRVSPVSRPFLEHAPARRP